MMSTHCHFKRQNLTKPERDVPVIVCVVYVQEYMLSFRTQSFLTKRLKWMAKWQWWVSTRQKTAGYVVVMLNIL